MTQRTFLGLCIREVPTSPDMGPKGTATEHNAAHQALQDLLKDAGLSLTVSPDPKFGYLRLVDGAGRVCGDWFANVSHTPGLVAAALCTSPVGVDVERLDRDPSRAVGRYLSAPELASLRRWRPPNFPPGLGPLALWTAKESFAKALGTGMQIGWNHLEIELDGPHPCSARTSAASPQALPEAKIGWIIKENHLVALCTAPEALTPWPPPLVP